MPDVSRHLRDATASARGALRRAAAAAGEGPITAAVLAASSGFAGDSGEVRHDFDPDALRFDEEAARAVALAATLARRDPAAAGLSAAHLVAALIDLEEASAAGSGAEKIGGEALGPPITLAAEERVSFEDPHEASGGREPSGGSRKQGAGSTQQDTQAAGTWGNESTRQTAESGEHRADSRESAPVPEAAVVRALDAAVNRAREGLRVLEDYARFVRDDRHLAEGLKQLRHELAEIVGGLSWARRAVCRDTAGDVGTTISTDSERVRVSGPDLILANAGRATEALRTVEEFGKTLGEYVGGYAQQLRYMLYTLEKALLTAERADGKLEGRNLYLITDATPVQTRATTRALASGAVGIVQLRDKTADDRTLLEAGRMLRKVTAAHDVLLIVNDRPDLAVATHADGVHVGQGDMPPQEARAIVGPDRLVGLSTHSLEQAKAGVLAGADYLGVGACFPTTTKARADVNGLDLVRAVAAEVSLPCFPIGGIGPDNVADVRAAGGRRAAVSGAILRADDPAAAASSVAAALGRSGES